MTRYSRWCPNRSRGARDQPRRRRLRQEGAGRSPAPAAAAGRDPGTAAAAATATATDAAAGAKPLTEEEVFAGKSVDQLNAEKPLGDVFFDYDSATVSEEGRAALQKNADWLKRWSSVAFTVEGHCDNRGTPEYNLALGERRANAVREYLVSLGVAGTRVQAVSKGEEQPFCREDVENCWSQNRRGHFIITGK